MTTINERAAQRRRERRAHRATECQGGCGTVRSLATLHTPTNGRGVYCDRCIVWAQREATAEADDRRKAIVDAYDRRDLAETGRLPQGPCTAECVACRVGFVPGGDGEDYVMVDGRPYVHNGQYQYEADAARALQARRDEAEWVRTVFYGDHR